MALPQRGIPDFVDSPREPYYIRKVDGSGIGGVGRWGKERKGKLRLVCKMKNKFKLKNKNELFKDTFQISN